MGQTILTPTQKSVLSFLSKEKNFSHFYLSGGTALSEYYLHHRLSEDLDFFSFLDIDELWITTTAKKITTHVSALSYDIEQSFNRNLVYFHFPKEILKTEFTYYPFPIIAKPKRINGIHIDSLRDIAVNKFFTIYQKPSARHFIDLYLILAGKTVQWSDLFGLARSKFDSHIDPIQLGSQLMLAQDSIDLPHLLIKLPESEWRCFFRQKAKELRSQIV